MVMNAMTLNHRYTLALYKTRSLGALRDPTSGHLEFVHRALQALRPCDPKSNAHAHVCAFVSDGGKKSYGPTDGGRNKAFLGVGFFIFINIITNIVIVNTLDELIDKTTEITFAITQYLFCSACLEQ